MLLNRETTDALNAARAEMARKETAASAALAALQEKFDVLKAENERLTRNIAIVCERAGLNVKRDFSDDELNVAGRRTKLQAQLGPGIGQMIRTARDRGMIR